MIIIKRKKNILLSELLQVDEIIGDTIHKHEEVSFRFYLEKIKRIIITL